MSKIPHGEPYAGKLHVRFDEGAGVPYGASRSTLLPRNPEITFPVYPPTAPISVLIISESISSNVEENE